MVCVMQLACDQLQYWLSYQRCAVCDFWRTEFTNKLTRRTSITKLFCEWRRERVKMIYFKLWVLEFNKVNPCAHMLVGNESPILENLLEISWNPSPISRFPSPKIRFSSHQIQFSPIGILLSSTAFLFLQQLSTFFNGFPLSSTAFQFSSTAFRFSSTTFLFPWNPRKSIYSGKYTKDHHPSFVFPTTCYPSFVIATCSPSFVITTRSPSFVIATMRASHPTHSCGAPVFPTVHQI
jgi:hypothetical protein